MKIQIERQAFRFAQSAVTSADEPRRYFQWILIDPAAGLAVSTNGRVMVEAPITPANDNPPDAEAFAEAPRLLVRLSKVLPKPNRKHDPLVVLDTEAKTLYDGGTAHPVLVETEKNIGEYPDYSRISPFTHHRSAALIPKGSFDMGILRKVVGDAIVTLAFGKSAGEPIMVAVHGSDARITLMPCRLPKT